MQETLLHIKQIHTRNNGKTSKGLRKTWSWAGHSKIISLLSFQTELLIIVDLPLSLTKQTKNKEPYHFYFIKCSFKRQSSRQRTAVAHHYVK